MTHIGSYLRKDPIHANCNKADPVAGAKVATRNEGGWEPNIALFEQLAACLERLHISLSDLGTDLSDRKQVADLRAQ